MISALGSQVAGQFVLVKVIADNGLIGLGEASVTPRWSGETVWGAAALITKLFGPAMNGCDPCDHPEVDRRLDAMTVDNWFAKSAVEMACWDLEGRQRGLPVYELLGGACRPLTIRSRFSLGAYTAAIARQRARELVELGFETIKIKVGTNPEGDVERVRAVRDEVGPSIALTVDANGGWNESQALWVLSRLADANISIVEQPLPRGQYAGLKRLRAATGCKILADESCFDEVEAVELIEQDCCDAISLYPGKQGGIAKAVRIAKLAEQHGLPCSIGSNLEWDVATAAMLHFIVATPNMRVELLPGDCLGPSYYETSLAKYPIRIEGSLTTLASAPGLGIDLDWELVERYRIELG